MAQSLRAPWLDVASSVVGLFGQAEVTGGIALGIAVARFRARRRDAVVPLFIAAVVLIEAALKLVVPQLPPPHERARTVELLPFLHVPFLNSFPSGHVARTAFLLRISHGIPTWVAVAGVALMIATRLYLGEHWLSDTVGGLLLGLGVASLAQRIVARPSPVQNRHSLE